VRFINPGSVGRPDDGDPRASYAILELLNGEIEVSLYRVTYPIQKAVDAMRKTGLPEIFTEVIRQGLNLDDARQQLQTYPKRRPLEPSGILTLLTDFGIKDHFVGVMKGVIAEIAPQTQVIDISHQVQPQDIQAGARMLAEAVPYFPPGTVHVAVIDPGVGTQRRALAARIGDYFYVAPDNGLLTPLIEKAQTQNQPLEIIALEEPRYWMAEITASFHGRDIFAPVGAHLVNGLPLEKLGPAIQNPVLLPLTQPERHSEGWQAQVVMIDVFGNLSTNLPESALKGTGGNFRVKIMGETILGLTRTFGDVAPGTLIATIDSTGHLAISVTNGSAQERLGAKVGTPVAVLLND
jgi:S-adenosylmethionine hydrolase